ncbi:hypothetical protein LguiB_001530 [Lonicera macranthoides]
MPQSSEAQINLNQIQTISKKSADGRTSNKYSVSPRSIHGEESSPLSYEGFFKEEDFFAFGPHPLRFPDDGTYRQHIEGSWNRGGKGPSIWDNFTHRYPGRCCYHQEYGSHFLSVFNSLVKSVTTNDYRDYAELCFKRFGDRVRNWVTFNEPWSFSSSGYDSGTFAPGRCSSSINPACTGGNSGTEPYLASHYQLKMHKGMIGITLVSTWMVPFSNSSLDRRAANRALDFMLGWFLEPVTTGDYPLVMRSLIGKRLPKFTREESKMLKGSYDFVGLNYYTAFYAAHIPASNNVNFAYSSDSRVNLTSKFTTT